MAKHDNVFVDRYETIRQMLHQLFVYGCYDRVQGAKLQETSGSSYSENIKRVKYFWPEQVSADRNLTGKKISRFPFSRYSTRTNFLARSYAIRSFRPQDINLYVFLLAALADGRMRSISQLKEMMDEATFADEERTEETSGTQREQIMYYPMVRAKLEAMTAAGFLIEEREGASRSYRLADDPLEAFSTEELSALYRVVAVYRDRLPLSSLGYRVQDVLGAVLSVARGDDVPEVSERMPEGVFSQSLLNDDLVYRILCAIERHHRVRICLKNEILHVIPLHLIFDQAYGRQYLFGVKEAGETFIRRLDLIHGFTETVEPFDPAAWHAAENDLRYLWNAALADAGQRPTPHEVTIDFRFSPQDGALKERLLRERRQGTIEQETPGHWRFRITLYDVRELIPWLRTFGRCVSVQDEAQHIGKTLADGWRELRASYAANAFLSAPSEVQRPSTASVPQELRDDVGTGLFTEFRNAYFQATLELYDRMILDGETFSKEKLLHFYREHAFPFPDKAADRDPFAASVGSFSYDIRKPALFRRDGDHFVPRYGDCLRESGEDIVCPPLPFLLMTEEKRWLCSLLAVPEVRQQLGAPLADRLRTALAVPPFPFDDVILRNGGDASPASAAATESEDPCILHLVIRPIHGPNEIERAFLLFSTWEKESWLDEETHLYHMRLRVEPGTQETLLEKLLSLGPAVMILSPDHLRETLLARIP